MTADVLDVTKIEPRLKHPTIFKHFDALANGASLELHNDHDPKPLYYQLLGERGATFSWKYLEEGPETWIVKIGKLPANVTDPETVGAISAKDYRKAEVFRKMGIDFCCGGEKTLQEAGAEAGLSEEDLKEALKAAEQAPVSPSRNYDKWDLDFLADFIVQTHHRYIKDNTEIIDGLAQKVAGHHGDNHPELKELAPRVHYFLQDLIHHMEKEENVLFPAIKRLAANYQMNQPVSIHAGAISRPISVMEAEHDHSGADLKLFRRLTNDYQLPQDACNSYKYLFDKMQELEGDLHEHIHLENNILFPKAIALENRA
jgi:regulator of cell morphogenesis and NO signaling